MANGDFTLVTDGQARRELEVMNQHLMTVVARHKHVESHDVAPLVRGLGEKASAVLAEVVGSAASVALKTRVDGMAYMLGTFADKKGALVRPDCRLIAACVRGVVGFDKA